MTDAIIDYIQSAELRDLGGSLLLGDEDLPQPQGSDEQGAVVDSNLVTFPEGTSARVKSLVSSWLLFAQRAANAKVPGRTDPAAWVSAYYDVLTSTGWVIRDSTDVWTTKDVYGSRVHDNIMAFVSVVLGPAAAALAIVAAAIKSLDDMDKDSPWITLFDHRGRTARTVGFSVANCGAAGDQSGGASLECVDFTIDAKQVMDQVLFFTFTDKSATMARRRMVLDLSADAAAAYGPAIKAAVDADVLSSIAAFELTRG